MGMSAGNPNLPFNTIGLRKGIVHLADYVPEWEELFEKEAKRLLEKIADLILDIQHVGSTAVPALSAKPIIDIAIAIESREVIPSLVRSLTELGYTDRGDGGNEGGYLLVLEPVPGVRTVHVHVVEATDVQWRNYIGFRDLLRENEDIREEYGRLKRDLANKHKNDRRLYTAGKHSFIRGLLGER